MVAVPRQHRFLHLLVPLLLLPSPLHSLSTPAPPTRIICFGDSLTAGTSYAEPYGGEQLFPYATHLRAALEKESPAVTWQVGHLGMPGWTAHQMVQSADDPMRGLRHKLRQVKNPPISLAVILAGTNDLGFHVPQQATGGIEAGAKAILESLKALHSVAHELDVPTLAVGIPTSRYQQQVSAARDLRRTVNEQLREWAESTGSGCIAYTPFPSRFVPDPGPVVDEDEFWCADGLHLTEKGYSALGGALAGPVCAGLGASSGF